MPEYLAPGVYIEETSFRTSTGDSFDFDLAAGQSDAAAAGTIDSEWIYVPVRRTADDSDGDIAGNFRDTDAGEPDAAVDPYSTFKFTVDWGGDGVDG